MDVLIYFVIFFQLIHVTSANRTNRINRTNRTVDNNKGNWEVLPKQVECYLHATDLIENITCKYRRLSRLQASYSFDAYIKPGVQIKDIIVKGTAYKKGTNLEYRVYGPKDVTWDFCGFLAGTWTFWIAEIMVKELKKAKNNIIHPCPYSGHVYIHNIRSTEDTYSMLNILPDGEYYYEGSAYTKINGGEELILKIKTFTEVVGKGLFKF